MKVALIMGSISDEEIVKKSAAVLKDFSVEYDCRVISAHRSLNLVLDYVESMEQNKIDIIIAFAAWMVWMRYLVRYRCRKAFRLPPLPSMGRKMQPFLL